MKASEALFAIADSETTGLEKSSGDELVEIGAWRWQYGVGLIGDPFETFVHPGRPIPVTASAIHHVTDRDVVDAPDAVLARGMFAEWIHGQADAIVCHNAEFDRQFLGEVGVAYLCSKRLAQHVVPLAPAHNNQVLRYHWGGVDIDLRGQAPHRAIADVIVTAFNLQHIFDAYFEAGGIDDLDTVVAYADSPIFFQALPFGKHRNDPITTVPESYLHWMVKRSDLGADMIYTAKTEIARRAKARNRGAA